MKEAGYVYILTNPSFKDDWVKIGKSSRPVDVRSKELDNTAVPLPFEIYATVKTIKYDVLEKNLHKTIDRLSDLRIRQSREFFNISPAMALDLVRDIANLIDDAEIYVYHDGKPCKTSHENAVNTDEPHKQRPRFRFSMVNIAIGSTLTFIPTGIEVRVASDDMVEYKEEKRNTSGAYQGSKYFSYKGEVLDDIRTKFEKRGDGKYFCYTENINSLKLLYNVKTF